MSTTALDDLVVEPIVADRISLTPLSEDDAGSMVSVLADPELYRFTGGEPPTPEGLNEQYRTQVRGGPADGAERWLNWIVRLADRPIGYVQATVTGSDHELHAEVAWVIGTPWQGQGRAREAAELMMAWLVARGVRRIVAAIHPEHAASHAVARRLGLALTAELTDEGEQVWTTFTP